ncbi:MAG TPA: M1 family metallopeptidase [Thermoanaerobaculia bacterium]|nr:M1 family metallopeptidase [Thermoanaerobaculia bacterium]
MKLPDLSSLTLLTLLGCIPWLFACSSGSGQTRPASPATGSAAAQAPASGTAGTPPATPAGPQRDVHSFSHPDEVQVDHLQWTATVDFNQRKLIGRASLRITNKTGADRLWLDTRDLDIQKVTLGSGASGNNPASPAGNTEALFTLGEPVEFLGRSLSIQIKPDTQWVHIDYSTRPEAAALQWLDPEQTASKTDPFLLTQSEAILARTWIPLQDTPGVRFTYDATVRVPAKLMAVMSAENPMKKSADGVYRFRMPQRIPSYLMALGVGNLEFRPLGPNSGVYAEPNVVEQAAWEFADTPKMIAAAEKLYGPYRWGRYDLLVLPPSFPYGGMENPRLTFVTPTVLARDRSLVSLIAHELAHSWSGNLVTNATWNDFWLNEGFTDYFERRIMESLYGKEYADMLWVLGRQDFETIVTDLGPQSPDTHLFQNLAGRDPDFGMNDIAYEKGSFFLKTIEQVVGRERFDKFLRTYFESHLFQSMDTRGFLEYLNANLLKGDEASRVQIDAWVFGPGIPANAYQPRAAAFDKVDQVLAAYKQGTAPAQLDTKGWSTQHWLHFLRNLPQPLDTQKMTDLDQAFHFTQSGNSEILNEWLLKAIANRYEPAYPALENFLTGMGRRKFLRPLYTALAKTPDGMEMALRIYRKARPGYHSVSRGTVDEILGWRG